MFTCSTLPDKSNLKFWSTDLWCLVDSMDPTGIAGLPYLRCSVLLANTPQRDCVGKFKKLTPTPVVLYMPLWTKEELGAIVHLYPNAIDKWENRFECLGGVPRLVLPNIENDPQELLESACKSCSLDECTMLVSINSEILQTLIHVHSQEPYLTYEVIYASELAMQVIARTKVVSDRHNMENLLQSLCEYIFEPYCLKLLHEGGVFEYRELFSGAQKKKPRLDVEEKTITIPSSL